jgi:hypothetical protein
MADAPFRAAGMVEQAGGGQEEQPPAASPEGGISTVDVTQYQAQHYTMRGDANLDTFYDLTPNWVGLRFSAKDGSEVRLGRP